jgi:hypothetical protein
MMKASIKPYCVAIITQLIYTGIFVISKAALNKGLRIHLLYRQEVGSLILLPTALLQRYVAIIFVSPAGSSKLFD